MIYYALRTLTLPLNHQLFNHHDLKLTLHYPHHHNLQKRRKDTHAVPNHKWPILHMNEANTKIIRLYKACTNRKQCQDGRAAFGLSFKKKKNGCTVSKPRSVKCAWIWNAWIYLVSVMKQCIWMQEHSTAKGLSEHLTIPWSLLVQHQCQIKTLTLVSKLKPLLPLILSYKQPTYETNVFS